MNGWRCVGKEGRTRDFAVLVVCVCVFCVCVRNGGYPKHGQTVGVGFHGDCICSTQIEANKATEQGNKKLNNNTKPAKPGPGTEKWSIESTEI